MGFEDFLGNERIVASLRRMLADEQVPNALLFLGPRGIGKYTLALMFAQAANCERLRDDFCGECDTCRKIARLANTAPLIEQGLAERGESADSAAVERIPLLLQTHPDVWTIVPDPIRLRNPVARPVIHMGQLRAVQRAAYFRPEARRRVFILDGAETMRWDLASVFLKILEEPPESSTLILLAPSPYRLQPTIVSRCLQFFFAPLAPSQMEAVIQSHAKLTPTQRARATELAEGSPGIALSSDIEGAFELRLQALRILDSSANGKLPGLFGQTNELIKKQSVPFDMLLDSLYSLLADLLELVTVPSHPQLRNPSLRKELAALATLINADWVAQAVRGVDQLSSRTRRNINRQLGLDAFGISLSQR
jgi:DNA polymerase III subunit delta'